MKTIFYKKSKDETGDYWFFGVPYIEWFTLENTLYDPSGSITKETIINTGGKNILHNIGISKTEDRFSDEGIIRRIALYISE